MAKAYKKKTQEGLQIWDTSYKIQIFSAFLLSFFCLGVYGWISGNAPMYLINEYVSYDSGLFPNNLAAYRDSISAKYIESWFSGMMFHVMDWTTLRACLYFLSVISVSAAVVNASVRLKVKNVAVSSLLMTVMILTAVCGNLAIYTTNVTIYDGYEAFGLGIGFLAISFCFGNPQWSVALILSGVASLINIHCGMYAGAFIFLLWLIWKIYKKEFFERKKLLMAVKKELLPGVLVWIGCTLLVVMPTLATSDNFYSSKEYMETFVWKRLGGHLSPYQWGHFNISKQYIIWIVLFAFIFLHIKRKEALKGREFLYCAAGVLLSFTAVIIFSMLFVDLMPVRFFADLFLTKYFAYGEFFILVLVACVIERMLHNAEERFLAMGLIVLLPMSEWTLVALLPAALLLLFAQAEEKVLENKKKQFRIFSAAFLGCIGIVLYFYLKNHRIVLSYNDNYAIWWGLLLLSGFAVYAVLYHSVAVKKYATLAVVGILCLDTWYYGSRICYHENGERNLTLKDSDYYLENIATRDIMTLADFARDNLNRDVIVLADARDYNNHISASWFQALSLRNVYVTDKVISYTDKGIAERNKRIARLSNWDNFTEEDFRNVMHEAGSRYILLKKEDKEKFNAYASFRCIRDTATYALYQLQED